MSLSILKPVTCRIPPVTGENGSHPNASKVTLVNKQALPAVKVQTKSMKEREQPLLQESSHVSSRRELMHLTALSLCFTSFFFPATSEARPRKATMKQKITENVDALKEKAGLSKGKTERKASELKEKAGLSKGKVAELKEKAAELKEKAGLSKGKVEELKEKAGLSKPKDEGKVNEKAKPKDAVAGINPEGLSQQTPAQAPQKEPSVPTLPTFPPLNFLTGRTVETSVS